jgi:hypothetical protein
MEVGRPEADTAGERELVEIRGRARNGGIMQTQPARPLQETQIRQWQ